MTDLAALMKRWNEADREAREAKAAYLNAVVEAAPFHVGDVVLSRGMEYRICEVEPLGRGGGACWYSGNPRKKDGTWGAAVRRLYSDVEPRP